MWDVPRKELWMALLYWERLTKAHAAHGRGSGPAIVLF